jgi:hypothetical protein
MIFEDLVLSLYIVTTRIFNAIYFILFYKDKSVMPLICSRNTENPHGPFTHTSLAHFVQVLFFFSESKVNHMFDSGGSPCEYIYKYR